MEKSIGNYPIERITQPIDEALASPLKSSSNHSFSSSLSPLSPLEAVVEATAAMDLTKSFDTSALESYKLFVGQIPRNIRHDELVLQFSLYGELHEVFVINDSVTGASKGCCFVRFKHRASADRCIELLNGKVMFQGATNLLQVSYAVPLPNHSANVKSTTTPPVPVSKMSPKSKPFLPIAVPLPRAQTVKLFVGGLLPHISENDLWQLFSRFGNIQEVVVLRFPNGQSRLSGFVKYETGEEANLAIRELNSYLFAGSTRPLLVRLASSPAPEHKLFIGHLPYSFDVGDIKQRFQEFGEIDDIHVLREPQSGASKGCAFVKYQQRASADLAIQAMNNSLEFGQTPLRVSFAISRGAGARMQHHAGNGFPLYSPVYSGANSFFPPNIV